MYAHRPDLAISAAPERRHGLPRGVKHLEALAIHYTDHNMPYGPFAVSKGHDMLVLHPKAGGIISMSNHDARRQIHLGGRLFASLAADSPWQPLPGAEHTEIKFLMPPDWPAAASPERPRTRPGQPAPNSGVMRWCWTVSLSWEVWRSVLPLSLRRGEQAASRGTGETGASGISDVRKMRLKGDHRRRPGRRSG